jgi:hypothetical protein
MHIQRSPDMSVSHAFRESLVIVALSTLNGRMPVHPSAVFRQNQDLLKVQRFYWLEALVVA